jgi:hypothetical protein
MISPLRPRRLTSRAVELGPFAFKMMIFKPAMQLALNRWIEMSAIACAAVGAVSFGLAQRSTMQIVPGTGSPAAAISIHAQPVKGLSKVQEVVIESAVGSIFRECGRRNCTLLQVTRASSVASDSGLPRDAVPFSVTGHASYSDLKATLSSVLHDNRRLSLDRIDISRRINDPGRIEFTTEWTMFGEQAQVPKERVR